MSSEAPLPFPTPAPPASGSGHGERITFDRRELSTILRLYGRMVAAGEWRDYAITPGVEAVSFAVFRRSAEVPLYRIEKRPRLRSRQGMYAVIAQGGQILRRGHDLESVLRLFDRRLIRPVE